MELKCSITETEFVAFNLHMVRRNPKYQKAFRQQRYAPVLIFLFLSVPFSKYAHLPTIAAFSLMLTLSVLWVLLYPRYFFNYAARKAKKDLKKNAHILGDYEYVLSKDFFTGKTEFGKEMFKWTDVLSFEEDPTSFYLFKSPVAAYIIPKKDLEDTQKVRDFIDKKLH
jgi:hypothetical protein